MCWAACRDLGNGDRMNVELLDQLRNGQPLLPLTVGQASAQAYRLRMKHGLPYTALAQVMGEYHGVWMGESYWRTRCRHQGAPITRPHNVTPAQRRQRAAA